MKDYTPYDNTPTDEELGFTHRKQRDNDLSMAFQFKSNEEILSICKMAVAKEQQAKLLALLRNENTLSVKKFLSMKMCNRK